MPLFSRKSKPVKMQSLAELQPMIESGKPVLLDFMQMNCRSCKIMDGIVNELAEEYGETAHIVKVDVTAVAGAAQEFKVRSTPTFILLSNAPPKTSKKAAKKAAQQSRPKGRQSQFAPRFRTSGLVKKDQLQRLLESNGATRGS
jgi:thioredoxin 1